MVYGLDFIRRFEAFCPLWLAEEGDPVGLHIGSLDREIKKIMMTLDVRPEVVKEAIEKQIDLIIAKHPPIFRPIQRLVPDTPQNAMYLDLVKHDISVYAAHTNMDIIEGGLNDWFCEALGVEVDNYLSKTHEVPMKKLVVYVPIEQAEQMRQRLGQSGAGKIGNYHHASYSLKGEGRFTPNEQANPTIGQINQAEVVEEERIEVIYPQTLETKVLAAMYQVHPYEEPAFDILQLDNPPKTYGLGRIGNLEKPLTLEDFITHVKETFDLADVRLIESDDSKKMVQRVAICGGSGEKFYPDAIRQKADVYLTGDVYYHTAHDIQATGLTVIDPGHHIEKLCVPKFTEQMNTWKQEENWEVEIIASETNTNPFQTR